MFVNIYISDLLTVSLDGCCWIWSYLTNSAGQPKYVVSSHILLQDQVEKHENRENLKFDLLSASFASAEQLSATVAGERLQRSFDRLQGIFSIASLDGSVFMWTIQALFSLILDVSWF